MQLKAHNKKLRRARERAAERDRKRMSEEAYHRSLLHRRLLRDAPFQLKNEQFWMPTGPPRGSNSCSPAFAPPCPSSRILLI